LGDAQGYFHDMEATPRLKAGIFVRALTRRAEVAGASAYVVRMGSEEAGALILKVARLDGTVLVLNQARDGKGALVWAQPLGGWADERRAADWCDKQVKFDPDVWIVEIEDRQGRAFVDEPIV
jgi:hypothetical protein